jgi:6-phosphogluconolactonase
MKTSRLGFVSKLFAGVVALLLSLGVSLAALGQAAGSKYVVYVGTYTTKQESKGIYAYRFDASTGKLADGALVAESTDPSFVAISPNGKYLYAVNEVGEFNGEKSGAISSYAIDTKTTKLKLLNQVSTHGGGPCYVSLDSTGKWVLVANYDAGSVASFEVQGDGSLSLVKGFVQHSGSSADKERQAGPHAHWIATSPDNRFALAADLGLDDVLVYKLDYEKGTLTSNTPPYLQVKPGSGPRHFAFHPNGKFGYLLTEMATTVTAFSYDAKKGALTAIQTVPTLPKGYSGPTEAAEIAVHPSGKFLYASNRAGVDTITSFSIDAKGMLKETGQVSTKGKTPRNFAIDPTGAYLLAANEESGNVVVFKIDAATGVLTPTGEEVKVSAPVSLAFLALEKAAPR